MEKSRIIPVTFIVLIAITSFGAVMIGFSPEPDDIAARYELLENPPEGYENLQQRFSNIWARITSLTLSELEARTGAPIEYQSDKYALPSFGPNGFGAGGLGHEGMTKQVLPVGDFAVIHVWEHRYSGGRTTLTHALHFTIDEAFTPLTTDTNPDSRIRWEEERLEQLIDYFSD
jgi:hypothetical protein